MLKLKLNPSAMKYLLRLLAVVSLLAAGIATATDVSITPASVLPGANAKTTL